MRINVTPLHELPRDHPLRNKPLKGCERRSYAKHGEDITITPEKRGPDWIVWKWTKWLPLKPMKIERKTFNDLSGPWIELNEFRFPEPCPTDCQPR